MTPNIFCQKCCGSVPVGVRYCGWAGPNVGSPFRPLSQYAWADIGTLESLPIQAYIDNINAYDMGSIPVGYMRLLHHDGQSTPPGTDPGTGALTGVTDDYKLTPGFYGASAPCIPGIDQNDGVYDPFFQGNPRDAQSICKAGTTGAGCGLVPCSFIGISGFDIEPVEQIYNPIIPYIVRCEVVYASSGGTGAFQDFDWDGAVFESVQGVRTMGVCYEQPTYMPKLTCSPGVVGGNNTISIPVPDITTPPSEEGGVWFKANYWFLGDTCSNVP